MKSAIQFSGGIDSLALLYLLRDLWDDCIVMWCDTGAAYPDVHDLMERIRNIVPHFMVVRGDQPESIRRFGYPVDVVPVSHTREGEIAFGPRMILFQSYLDCCARARFRPMQAAVQAVGVTTVYRGQRDDDKRRPPIDDGFTEAGITYRFPLRSWKRAQVFDYVREHAPDLIPAYYAEGEKTSRDCWNCTAYRDDNVARVENLPPAQRAHVERVIHIWRTVVQDDMRSLKE